MPKTSLAGGCTPMLLTTMVLLSSPAHAECLAGRYAGTASSEQAPQAPLPVLVTLTCDNGVLGGRIESPQGVMEVEGGETTPDSWRIRATLDSQPVTAEVVRRGQDWQGHFSAGPDAGTLALQRDDTATFAALNGEKPVRLDLSAADWNADLLDLAQELPQRHLKAFHQITEAQWRAAVTELAGRLPSIPDREKPVALKELVARIGDGHTRLELPPARHLPVGLFWFGPELRIVSSTPSHRELLGAQVLSIGGKPAHEAGLLAGRLTSQENPWTALAASPSFLRREDVLNYLHLAAPGETVHLRVRASSGKTLDVDLPFQEEDGSAPVLYVGGAAPLWQQEPHENLWWRELPGGLFYINFRAYGGLRTQSAALFRELDERKPAQVVLDMRDNGGGDFTVFRDSVLPAIQSRPWLNDGKRLYVVIGREMFSAAMTNAADLKLHTHATLVGEPIGERPNSYQELGRFSLPHSNLRVGVSVQYYEALPGAGNPDAVTPQVMRPPSWRLFAQGRDDALEWVAHNAQH